MLRLIGIKLEFAIISFFLLIVALINVSPKSIPESTFDFDIKQISQKPFADYLKEKEDGELSDEIGRAHV